MVIRRGMKEYHKENRMTRKAIKQLIALDIKGENSDEDDEEDDDNELKTLKMNNEKEDNYNLITNQEKITLSNVNDSRLEQEHQLDIIKCPLRKMAEIFVSFILLIIITLLKGSDNLPSFLQLES